MDEVTKALPTQSIGPDKFGFMLWQWVTPPTNGRYFGRIERARAKFVSDKNNVVTIRTDAGQILKIEANSLGRQQRQWLDAERAKKAR